MFSLAVKNLCLFVAGVLSFCNHRLFFLLDIKCLTQIAETMIFLKSFDMNCRGWINYILPSISVIFAGFMIWQRYTSKRRPLEAFKIKAPPSKNAVEQLVTLQEAVLQVEGLIQSGNVVLLKLRALLFAIVPQVSPFILFACKLDMTLNLLTYYVGVYQRFYPHLQKKKVIQ